MQIYVQSCKELVETHWMTGSSDTVTSLNAARVGRSGLSAFGVTRSYTCAQKHGSAFSFQIG